MSLLPGRAPPGPLLLLFCAALLLGGDCTPGSGSTAPSVDVNLNAVPDDLGELMVVPPSGFAVNLAFTAQGSPVDLGSFQLLLTPWTQESTRDITHLFAPGPEGGSFLFPAGEALAMGSYTLTALVRSEEGDFGVGSRDFAVRDFSYGNAPIGTGQVIWYDFGVDRDGAGGADFPGDLELFGLGSPAEATLSAQVETRVIDEVRARVESAFHDEDPNGLGVPDPVDVAFFTGDPGAGAGDVTRICVGGVSPDTPILIGSVLIDPNNGNRTSVECGTIPPSGVFVQGMLAWSGNPHFQATFDPLMPSRGGTPVGEHPLDPIVLDPGFDPATGSAAEVARWADLETAIVNFSNALGTVVAHETGHALGLVAPGAPGVGLHGGQSGAAFSHAVTSTGGTPSEPVLMRAGNTLGFQAVAGIGSNPLPYFRSLSWAYLRDRVVQDPDVTELLAKPVIEAVSPEAVEESTTEVIVTGSDFADPPALRIRGPVNYDLAGESFVSDTEVRGWVVKSQVPPGIYSVEVENPDGQLSAHGIQTLLLVP